MDEKNRFPGQGKVEVLANSEFIKKYVRNGYNLMYIYNILAEKHKITITYKTFHYHIRKMNILEFRKYKKQPHNGKKTLPVSRNVTFNLTYAAEKDLAMQKKLAEEENFLNKPSDMPDDAVQKLVDDLI